MNGKLNGNPLFASLGATTPEPQLLTTEYVTFVKIYVVVLKSKSMIPLCIKAHQPKHTLPNGDGLL